jgi:hypothetical protein
MKNSDVEVVELFELFGLDIGTKEGREKAKKVARAALTTGLLLFALAMLFVGTYLMIPQASVYLLDAGNLMMFIALPFVVFAAFLNSALRKAEKGGQ